MCGGGDSCGVPGVCRTGPGALPSATLRLEPHNFPGQATARPSKGSVGSLADPWGGLDRTPRGLLASPREVGQEAAPVPSTEPLGRPACSQSRVS